MREVKFILPTDGNHPGNHPAHAFARKALVESFGGFTTYDSQGGWRNNAGAVMLEPGITYVVAITQGDGLCNFIRFREIALQAGRMAEQEAVYVVGPEGGAEIVSLVDVGKTFIQADAKAGPRRPQVGDFWETADGSKVYVEYRARSSPQLTVRIVKCGGRDWPIEYIANLDGRYAQLGEDSHPLDLKRFIGC